MQTNAHELCNKNLDINRTDEFFLCGPENMIFSVKDQLEKMGVDKKKIHFELFTTPGQKKIDSCESDSRQRKQK
jgi:ring-1,2-phenylacetyl-CoA epoxidase subunit PaaE